MVSFSTFMRPCGIHKFIVGSLWLGMHIIDVSNVSTYW